MALTTEDIQLMGSIVTSIVHDAIDDRVPGIVRRVVHEVLHEIADPRFDSFEMTMRKAIREEVADLVRYEAPIVMKPKIKMIDEDIQAHDTRLKVLEKQVHT